MGRKKYYPTLNELKEEIDYLKEKKRKGKNILNFLIIITFIISLIIIINVYFIPIYEIKGTSMDPTFKRNDVVAVLKGKKIERNDIIAFDYNGKILIKRVIGVGGDKISITEDGKVFVNDKELIENYAINIGDGVNTQDYPFTVPADSYFVLSDNRKESFDSRNINLGSISQNQVIGKIKFIIWPVKRIKIVER